MRLRIDLDEQTTEQLIKAAEAERRPLAWEAEVLLKRALVQPVKVRATDRQEVTA